jgi:hypothetical protein
VQRLAQQAARQHAVQVLQRQGLDLLEHRRAEQPALLLQRLRVQLVAAGLGLDLVQRSDELDEARRQLIGPAPVLGQRLQRVMEVPPAMRPAAQVHEPVLLGDRQQHHHRNERRRRNGES